MEGKAVHRLVVNAHSYSMIASFIQQYPTQTRVLGNRVRRRMMEKPSARMQLAEVRGGVRALTFAEF